MHANIQDGFRDADIEILSPTYQADRDGAPRTVPPVLDPGTLGIDSPDVSEAKRQAAETAQQSENGSSKGSSDGGERNGST